MSRAVGQPEPTPTGCWVSGAAVGAVPGVTASAGPDRERRARRISHQIISPARAITGRNGSNTPSTPATQPRKPSSAVQPDSDRRRTRCPGGPVRCRRHLW